jgi:hypothetical protein
MHPTFIRLACKNKTEYLEYSKLYIKPTAKKTTKYNENELNMKKKKTKLFPSIPTLMNTQSKPKRYKVYFIFVRF